MYSVQQLQQQRELQDYGTNNTISTNYLVNSNNQASVLQNMKVTLDQHQLGDNKQQFAAINQQYKQLHGLDLEQIFRQTNGNVQNVSGLNAAELGTQYAARYTPQQTSFSSNYYPQIPNVLNTQNAQNAAKPNFGISSAQQNPFTQRLQAAQQMQAITNRQLSAAPSVNNNQFQSYDQQAHYILRELGKYLAILQIQVSDAISVGLLGGLGAGDLKILQEAHSAQLLLSTPCHPQNPAAPNPHLLANILANDNVFNIGSGFNANHIGLINACNATMNGNGNGNGTGTGNGLPTSVSHATDLNYESLGCYHVEPPPMHDEEAFQARFANLCLGTGF